VLARNSHAFAALRFALARLGAVLVPINFMLKAEECRLHPAPRRRSAAGHRQRAGGPGARCGGARHRGRGFRLAAFGAAGRAGARHAPFDELCAVHADAPPVDLAGEDLAQIVYTSGTEILPKGAMLTHEAVIWQYVSCIVDAGIAADDLMLHALPLYHCAQLDVFLGPGVYVGASNVITGEADARQPAAADRTPPHHQLLRTADGLDRAAALAAVRPLRPGALAKGYYGASIMPVAVMREILAAAAGAAAVEPVRPDRDRAAGDHARPRGPAAQARLAGRAVLNVETRVVDDAMRDVAPGEVGEIVHRSPHLMRGYFHDDERTAAASRAAGSTAATWRRSTTRATSRSSTARRT
jgi:fatty-acyl-CoA synthase